MRIISVHLLQFLLVASNRNVGSAGNVVSLGTSDCFLLFAGAFCLAGVRDGRDALLALYMFTGMHWVIVYLLFSPVIP